MQSPGESLGTVFPTSIPQSIDAQLWGEKEISLCVNRFQVKGSRVKWAPSCGSWVFSDTRHSLKHCHVQTWLKFSVTKPLQKRIVDAIRQHTTLSIPEGLLPPTRRAESFPASVTANETGCIVLTILFEDRLCLLLKSSTKTRLGGAGFVACFVCLSHP